MYLIDARESMWTVARPVDNVAEGPLIESSIELDCRHRPRSRDTTLFFEGAKAIIFGLNDSTREQIVRIEDFHNVVRSARVKLAEGLCSRSFLRVACDQPLVDNCNGAIFSMDREQPFDTHSAG